MAKLISDFFPLLIVVLVACGGYLSVDESLRSSFQKEHPDQTYERLPAIWLAWLLVTLVCLTFLVLGFGAMMESFASFVQGAEMHLQPSNIQP